MSASKMTNTEIMKDIITEMARYVKDSGFSVDWNRSMGWVAIHDDEENDDTFFLEEGDAEEFVAEANQKAEEADVDLETGMLAQAKQYIDSL